MCQTITRSPPELSSTTSSASGRPAAAGGVRARSGKYCSARWPRYTRRSRPQYPASTMMRSHLSMGVTDPYRSAGDSSNTDFPIRPAVRDDDRQIWRVIEPAIRAGETYPLARNLTQTEALAYWCAPQHEVFVVEEAGAIVGSYYLRANNQGGGAHVANCGYIIAAQAERRDIARAMCAHSME